MVLQDMADLNSPLGAVTTVRVDQQGGVGQCGAHGRNDLLRSARPFVLIAPYLGAGADLECVKTLLTSKALQPLSLILRRNVALHG